MENPLYRHASEIAFGDTDASGWMHFPNIFNHVEAAEHALLRSRGLLVFDRDRGGWPRVKVACDYKRPLVCGERIEVQLAIAAVGASSVTWNFEVINAAGELAALGSITTVRVNHLGRPQALDADERSQLPRGR
jgi:acyl-CoA thioesterase FadM